MSRFSELQKYLDHKLPSLLERQQIDKDIPALGISLFSPDQVVWRYEKNTSPQLHPANRSKPLYRIGSITKLFTQILIMNLVEEKRLTLESRLSDIAPDCTPVNPYNTPIRIEHLLTHTSGIQRELPGSSYLSERFTPISESVPRLSETKLMYEPGSETRYSNAATNLLGLIAERLYEEEWDVLIQQRLFTGLELESAHTALTDGVVVAEARFNQYLKPTIPAPRFGLGSAPAGSLVMSLDDLARFAQALINRGVGPNGRFIKANTLERMWQTSFSEEHGLGFFIRPFRDSYTVGHGGTIYGFSSELILLPEKNIGVVVCLTRDISNGFALRIGEELLEIASEAAGSYSASCLEMSSPLNPEAEVRSFWNGDDCIDLVANNDRTQIEFFGFVSELRTRGSDVVIDSHLAYLEDISLEGNLLTINNQSHKQLSEDEHWVVRSDHCFGIDETVLVEIYTRNDQLWIRLFGVIYQPLVTRGDKFTFPPSSPLFAGEIVIVPKDMSHIEIGGAVLERVSSQ